MSTRLSIRKITISISILLISFLCVQAQSAGSNVREVIVVCKTHFDIGYTQRVEDIVNFYRTDMIDKAFGLMETMDDRPVEQRFAWTLPGWVAWKTQENFPGQSAERREKMNEAFRTGKIIVHALPFTMETDACEMEELVRGLGFASRLARKYDLPLPRSGKQTDVPSHSGAMATLLANSGIKFLHIGSNWPSGFVQTPGLFWWEGPDGSRVLTMYSPVYGTSANRFYGNGWKGPQGTLIGKDLLPPDNWPCKVWPAILVTSDNVGAPTAEQVKALFDEAQAQMPGATFRMGTMDDFYDAIMKENLTLPIVKAEMPDTWIHGIMCDPEGVRMSREVHPLLASTEVLNTQLRCWGIQMPSFAQSIADAYENILLYGEHTWGRSTKVNKYGKDFENIPAGEYADLEASWEDKTDYIREASRMTHEMNRANMNRLAGSVKQKEPSILVYNPLPWTRSGIVEIDGQKIYVKDIPPCGYRTFPIKKQELVSERLSNSIENDFFRIVFDAEKGAIASLYDKRTGREWVDTKADHGLGQYLNERFTLEQTMQYATLYQQEGTKGGLHTGLYKPAMVSEKEVSYRAASSGNGKLTITGDSYMQTAELTMPGDATNHLPATVLRVTLPGNEPYLDMEIIIKDKAKDNWPEADWLCLPFNIDRPKFHVHRPLGVMNPKDIPMGANRHLYAAGNGITITGADGSGVAVCPVDHPLVSLDMPGCWKFSNDFVPQKPVIYLNLYNNQWNTNFRYWYPGTWSSRVRVWILGGSDEKDIFLATRALETRNSLQAVVAPKNTGTMPAKQSGIEVSRKGVTITAFGDDPDGNPGTLLRVWEQAGVSGKLTVILPTGMKASRAIPVDLRGEKKGTPLPVKSGKFDFELGKYAPASFILE